MMKMQAYAALILAAVFSTSSAQQYDFTTYNVKMFMNTTLRIWTYNTTENASFYCKVDDVQNITEKSVFFNRSYWRSNWTTVALEGTFSEVDLKMMLVGGAGGLKDHSESLQFASDDYQCGVFYVQLTAGFGWHDLRFKDFNGTGKPEKVCQDYFNDLHKKGYLLYGDYCKNMP